MPLLEPNLDDRRFAEILEEASRLIPRYAPKWTDHNLHDPGITLIELFAWLVEMQLYHLNQVPERNYLKFLTLLEAKPEPLTPAKVDLTFSSGKIVAIPEATKLVTKVGQADITFETDEDIEVLPIGIKKIISYSNYKHTDVTDHNESMDKFYYAFGENPQVGDVLYLGFDPRQGDMKDLQNKNVRLKVYLYEKDLPQRGKHGTEEPDIYPSAEIAWEYATTTKDEWKPLSVKMIRKIGKAWQEWDSRKKKWTRSGSEEPEVGDKTLSLLQSSTISFLIPDDAKKTSLSYPQDEEPLFWIRAKLEEADYEMPPRVITIRLNTVSATEGVTVKDETLSGSSGLPDQTFRTKNKPILAGDQGLSIQERVCVKQDEEWKIESSQDEAWQEVDDFDASGPDDNHYVLDRLGGEILFGNGLNGRIPPKELTVGEDKIIEHHMRISYRYGGGKRGNVAADTKWRFSDIDGVRKWIKRKKNWFPAAGGKEEESVDKAKTRARRELKVRYRAVTSEDFEDIAKATPGLRVARTGVQISASENKAKVAVVPYVPHSLSERPIPSGGFKRTVCEHLDKHRLITTQIEVVGPHYVKASVSASVKTKSQSSPEEAKRRVAQALNTFLHPLEGGPDGGGWPFGRDVYKSEVYEVIEKVEGVDGVVDLSISKDGEIDGLTLVYPGSHRVEIVSPQVVCKEESVHG